MVSRINPTRCRHKNLVLFGSEETGLSRISCGSCGTPMGRRIEAGEYVYFPVCARCGMAGGERGLARDQSGHLTCSLCAEVS